MCVCVYSTRVYTLVSCSLRLLINVDVCLKRPNLICMLEGCLLTYKNNGRILLRERERKIFYSVFVAIINASFIFIGFMGGNLQE